MFAESSKTSTVSGVCVCVFVDCRVWLLSGIPDKVIYLPVRSAQEGDCSETPRWDQTRSREG